MTGCNTNNNLRRSRVRFEEQHNRTQTFEKADSVQALQLWYQQVDYARMRSNSKTESKQCRQQGLHVLVENTFQQPKPNAQDCLNALSLLQANQSRRGLERYLSRQHCEERSALKQRARRSVLELQQQLKKKNNNNEIIISYEEVSQSMSAVYAASSAAAVDFARRLGKVDALAAAVQDDDETLAARVLPPPNKRPSMERQASNRSMRSTSSIDSLQLYYQQQQRLLPAARARRAGPPAAAVRKDRLPRAPTRLTGYAAVA